MIESRESARGCGYRKVGGLYLVFDGQGVDCGKLPIPLHVCPTCGAGIKPARGWTWIDGDALTAEARARKCPKADNWRDLGCPGCPMDQDAPFGRAGLIWIGESFYSTPDDFQREAAKMGISRRIASVPRGFEIGKTFVFMAHRLCVPEFIEGGENIWTPGVFSIFVPSRIEIICNGTESEEQIADYEGRGLTPVKVIRLGENKNLFQSGNDSDEEIN